MATSRQFFIGASIAAAALIAAPAGTAAAQPGSVSRAHSFPEAPPPRTAERLEDAQRLMMEGRFRDARYVYRALANEQLAASEYPSEALRGLANVEFALNDTRATAEALDELADAASRFGDPETRVRSLFQAALLYQGLKYHDRVSDHIGEIRTLLKSPAIADSTRNDITARIPVR